MKTAASSVTARSAGPRPTFTGQTWGDLADYLSSLAEAAAKVKATPTPDFPWPDEAYAAARARANTFAVCANLVRDFSHAR